MSKTIRDSLMLFLVVLILLVCDVSAGTMTQPSAGDEFEQVLIPVFPYGVAGANGSIWQTNFWVANTTDHPIVYFFSECNLSSTYCEEVGTYPPQSTRLMFASDDYYGLRGGWFGLPTDGSLQLQIRLRDVSRSGSPGGVEIPLVRESQFRTSQLNLIGIPRDPRLRVALRFYGMDDGVRLRVEQIDGRGVQLEQHDVDLSPSDNSQSRPVPPYAELRLSGSTTAKPPIRIRVTPLTEGARFWAFASITDNETSAVSLVTPWW